MLQQSSDLIMYQKFPLDLNMHSAERADFKNIAPAGPAFLLDAFSVKATAAPLPAAAMVPVGVGVGVGVGVQGVYEFPFQAVYDPLLPHRLQHLQHYYQLAQQHDLQHQHQQQPQKPPLLHHLQIQHLQPQEQSYVPMVGASSTELWQQQQREQLERRGCWFPNWQDVFHGSTASKEDKHKNVSSFQQTLTHRNVSSVEQPLTEKFVMEKPPLATMVGSTEAQQLQMFPDGAQVPYPRPLSPPLPNNAVPEQTEKTAVEKPTSATTVRSSEAQQLCMRPDGTCVHDSMSLSPPLSNGTLPDLPQPPFEAEKKGDGAVNTVFHANDTELQDAHFDRAESTRLGEISPASSHLVTALVACSQKNTGEGSLVPFTDLQDPSLPPSVGASGSKYITQSPAWLPPGWITEVQTRRTGTTAGTRDKYYKDLASGRRFRSRNEVIHFLQTGKGRFRRRRRRRALTSPGFGGPVGFITHQPQSLVHQETSTPCLFLAPQPIGFVLGPLVNTPPVPLVTSVVTEQVDSPAKPQAVPLVPPMGDVTEAGPCQIPVATSNANKTPEGVILGLKRPVEIGPQKLPIHKKSKVLSPKTCDSKEASRLWQWLHKPVARAEGQPQKEDSQKQVRQIGEKKAPDIDCQRKAKEQGREFANIQRTAQLGRDIEAAQRTLTHLGKEMQSTIMKLIQTIQAAKGDLKFEADASCRTDTEMSNVFQATQRFDSAMGNLTEATASLVCAVGCSVYAMQPFNVNVGSVALAAKQPPAAGAVQEAAGFDVTMVHAAPGSYGAQVFEKPIYVSGSSMQTCTSACGDTTSATEPFERRDNSRACSIQAAQLVDNFECFTSEPHHRPDNPGASSMQAGQPADIRTHYATGAYHWHDNLGACNSQAAHLSNLCRSYPIQRAQRSDYTIHDSARVPRSPFMVTSLVSTEGATNGVVDATGTLLNVEQPSQGAQAYQKALEVSKQITEARSKFSALNPKLDLSLLSPDLSSRQRAKEVQKMKYKHARGLLVILGRKLCHTAIGNPQKL